jgi:tetratricopeptide (TPR) repeat protein
MSHRLILITLALGLLFPPAHAAAKRKPEPKAEKPAPAAPAAPPAAFGPLPQEHALASLWNDPDFSRRLLGSYGFASEAEPRMAPEEQALYRDKILPLLRESPEKAVPALLAAAKPGATAVFDFTLGNIYFQNAEFTNAVKHFESALAKFPDYRRAQKNLAFVLMRDGKYKEAIAPLLRTITLEGADGKVFGLLGFAYMNENRFVSAAGAYQQALVFEPENVDYKLGLVKCAVATANYDHALAMLDELLEQHPERENLWSLEANIFIQKDQPAKAAVSLEVLRRAGKASAQNLFMLGDLYMTQEARELALPAYLEAVEKDAGQNSAKALRAAQILVSRGAWDEARSLFAKIRGAGRALESADELKLLRMESKVAMATGEGAKAIETLEQVIQRNPLDGEALLLAGEHYARNGQREKAEFRYQSAAAIPGFEADAFVKHAQLLIQSQKYPQALELLHKAQKIKPRDNIQRYLEKVEQMSRASRS